MGYAENVTISNVTNNVSIILRENALRLCLPVSPIIGRGSDVTVGGKTKEEAVKNNGDILVKSKVANVSRPEEPACRWPE